MFPLNPTPDMPDVQQPPVPLPAGLVGGEPGASPIPGLGAQPAPQPGMPDVQQPGGATMPSVPGMGVAGAPPPGPPNPMDALRAEIAKWQTESADRRKQHEQFLQQILSTNGLDQFLPKPSAKQMLSDALANFGMARLTGGQFTPIQVRRFDEAFKRHGAAAQNAQLMLSSDRQDELAASNAQAQMLKWQQLSERYENDQAKQAQAQQTLASRDKATQAALDFKKAVQQSNLPLNSAKEDQARAKASLDSASAQLLMNGGGNVSNALAHYAAANGLDLTKDDDMKEYLDAAAKLRDATRFKPQAGNAMIDRFFPTKDGNIVNVIGSRGGAKTLTNIELPDGYGNMSPGAKNNLTQLATAESLAGDVKDMLESVKTADGTPLKDVGKGSLWDAMKIGAEGRAAYTAYIKGIGNEQNPLSVLAKSPGTGNEQMDKLIQYAAMLKIIGAQPYLHGIRNMQYVGQIMVHLPNEKSDTPAMMYKKLTSLMPQWDRMRNEIVDYEKHPLSASKSDSQAAATPPRNTPGTPGGGKKDGGALPSVGDKFNGGTVKKVTRIE